MQHSNEVAILLYDNLIDKLDTISNNIIGFTKFSINKSDLIITRNISNSLRELSKHKDWAVVFAAGNYIKNIDFIVQKGIEYMKNNDVPLVCHILDKAGYFQFDPQFFMINLKIYNQLDCPSLEIKFERTTFDVLETVRSEENIHDNYTPLWLIAGKHKIQYETDKHYFGSNLIAALINAGHKIYNVPMEIRQKKFFYYPNNNAKEIKKIIPKE